jgi:diguanylate cyclase (GGDEF)-like protein
MKQKKSLNCFTFLSVLALLALIGLYCYLIVGVVKPWATIKWLDALAEGGTTLLAVFWLILLLRSRPAGRVTLLLALGLACFVFSWWVDFIDEFIKIPNHIFWDNWLESFPVPMGLVLLTTGIYHWHKEELAISAQMLKRERVFREHRLFDALIPLGGAEYLREQVKLALKEARLSKEPLALVAIDLNEFSQINLNYGHQEGDQVLQSVTQLLLLNLRGQDLLCRLAGDRFVTLLPNTTRQQALMIADDLKLAISYFAYKTSISGQRVKLSASVAVASSVEHDVNTLIKNLNFDLGVIKNANAVKTNNS